MNMKIDKKIALLILFLNFGFIAFSQLQISVVLTDSTIIVSSSVEVRYLDVKLYPDTLSNMEFHEATDLTGTGAPLRYMLVHGWYLYSPASQRPIGEILSIPFTGDLADEIKIVTEHNYRTETRIITRPNLHVNDTSYCNGSSVLLQSNSYGVGFNYLWSTGDTTENIEVSEPGTYYVTVSNEYPENAVDSIVVTQIAPPEVILNSAVFPMNGEVELVPLVHGEAAFYFWSTGESTPSIVVSDEGEYRVTVTNELGCSGYDSAYVTEAEIPSIRFERAGACLHDTLKLALVTSAITEENLLNSFTCSFYLGQLEYIGSEVNPEMNERGAFSIHYQNDTLYCSYLAESYLECEDTILTLNLYTEEVGTHAVEAHDFYLAEIHYISVPNATLQIYSLDRNIIGDAAICDGDTFVFHPEWVSGNSFHWENANNESFISDTLLVHDGGLYFVQGTDGNGCIIRDSAIVSVNRLPAFEMNDLIIDEGSIGQLAPVNSANRDTATYSFLWWNGETASFISVNSAGTREVTIFNVNTGCEQTISANVVIEPINEVEKNMNTFTVSPSIASDFVSISANAQIDNVVVYDALGQIQTMLLSVNDNNALLNVQSFQRGIYLATIKTNVGTKYTCRFIVK